MKTLKSNLKQPIIFAKIIAVSIAIFLCASCDNGNGKRLAKAKNDPAGTYREYLSDIRRQKKLSIKELAGHPCVIIRFDRPSCSPIAPRKEGAHTLKVG